MIMMEKIHQSSEMEDIYNKYIDMINDYEIKYSSNSLIVYMMMLQLLTVMNNLESDDSDCFLEILTRVKHMARRLKMPQNKWEPMSVNDKNLIHFDKKYYIEHYLGDFEKYSKRIIKIDMDNIRKYSIGKWYLYIIDENFNLIIYDCSFNPIDILYDRLNYPKHAVLAYNSNLNVYCAGEILLKAKDNNYVSAILNNKSGHFKPDLEHLKIADKVLRKLGCRTTYIDYSK